MAPELMTVKNNLNISHWNMETGYERTTQTVDTYPIRVFNSNPFHGLNIYLQLFEHDLDFVCRGPIQGFIQIQITHTIHNNNCDCICKDIESR